MKMHSEEEVCRVPAVPCDPQLPSRTPPEISSRDILGRFGGHAQMQYPCYARKRNSRYHVPRPSLALSLGLVKDMIGYWDTRVEASLPTPCGCGDKNCPVSSDTARAVRHRWQFAMERIRTELKDRRHSELIPAGFTGMQDEVESVSDLGYGSNPTFNNQSIQPLKRQDL